jgi:DNA-binding NarL/FixJ family response regulator
MRVNAQPETGGVLISGVEPKRGEFGVNFSSPGSSLTSESLCEGARRYDDLTLRSLRDDSEDEYGRRAVAAPEDPGRIVVIEPRAFLRDCIQRGMRSRFTQEFVTFSSVEEYESCLFDASTHLIILSCSGSNELEQGGGRANLERLSALAAHVPVVVLASRQDPEFMRVAMTEGAKGYIPMSMGFDIAVEAVRFVLAGGTYVPADLLIAAATAAPSRPATTDRPAMTSRELLVTRAIQQGKPNKVIAYELNMCENTVKVHVRHIMKKLGAKNRTDVAMKSRELTSELAKAR